MDRAAESDKAYAARITQHLKGPSDALIGFQTLLLEEVRRNGPQEALQDLEKVRASALHLNDMIRSLTADGRSMPEVPEAQSRIRQTCARRSMASWAVPKWCWRISPAI